MANQDPTSDDQAQAATQARDSGEGTKATSQVADASTAVSEVNREFQEKSTLKHAGDLGLPYINIAKTPLNVDFLNLITSSNFTKGTPLITVDFLSKYLVEAL